MPMKLHSVSEGCRRAWAWQRWVALALVGASWIAACGGAPMAGAPAEATNAEGALPGAAPPPPPPPPPPPITPPEAKAGAVVSRVVNEAAPTLDAMASDGSEGGSQAAKPGDPAPVRRQTKEAAKPKRATSGKMGSAAHAPAPEAATTTSLGVMITETEVDDALGPKLHELRACASTDSSLSVHINLAPGGRVAEAAVTRSTPDDGRLRDCVAVVLRGLAFRSASADRGSALSFDLALAPLDPR